MSDLPSLAYPGAWLEKLSVPVYTRERLLWFAAAALGVYCVRRLARPIRPAKTSDETDFNSFLITKAKPKRSRQPKSSTSFDAFLKEDQPPVTVATSFEAYLKNPHVEEGVEKCEVEHQIDKGPRDDQAIVTVLFGTEYGFAREISERLCGMLQETNKYWPRMLDMASFPCGLDLAKEQALVVVCSTQGDGVPPSEARDFCDWLKGSEAPMLPSTSYSVCALGDTSYTHFCACGKQIDARLAALDAKSFVPRKDVNREDWKAVNAWLKAVVEGLDALQLRPAAETGLATTEINSGVRLGKNQPFLATIVEAEGLCNVRNCSDKDTIRVEIDLGDSGLEYTPGDALGIYASNAEEVVEDLLGFIGGDQGEMHALPSWHFVDKRRPQGSQITLREMLTHCYDLRTPKSELLQLLLEHMPSEGLPEHSCVHKKLQANGVLNGHAEHHIRDLEANGKCKASEEQENGHSEAIYKASRINQRSMLQDLVAASEEEIELYFEPRHVVDVLMDFPTAKPPLEKLLRCLRPLQPRLYSISSSPLENPTRVQVTVAVVRYSSLQKERLGVASTYLAERIQVGDQLPVYIAKNPDFRLPADSVKPIVMVGPGTGLAPFRAFMMQRILMGGPFGKSILYFGCRRRDQDYLYCNLLRSWDAQGHISLHTAFSREQGQKVYVQDRLRQTSDLVWEVLEAGGHFYVCGDAAHMAAAVEETLLEIIERNQEGGQAAAQGYLSKLQAEQRYQRDVWF